MTMSTLARQHLTMALAAFQLDCQRLAMCIHDADHEHHLPGAIADCHESLAAIITVAGCADPRIVQAITHGQRTTQPTVIDPQRAYTKPGEAVYLVEA